MERRGERRICHCCRVFHTPPSVNSSPRWGTGVGVGVGAQARPQGKGGGASPRREPGNRAAGTGHFQMPQGWGPRGGKIRQGSSGNTGPGQGGSRAWQGCWLDRAAGPCSGSRACWGKSLYSAQESWYHLGLLGPGAAPWGFPEQPGLFPGGGREGAGRRWVRAQCRGLSAQPEGSNL